MPGRGRRNTFRRRVRIFFVYTQILMLLILAVVLGVVGGTFISVSKMLPDKVDIANYKPAEITKIISSDGVILATIAEENRELVQITDIPRDLQNATIAIEDKRFYRHIGVDFRGMGRALVENLKAGRLSQGGSTITQQLARNIYLNMEKKLSRKLQEMVLAIQLERNYSKEEILELYLNEVYYGSGSYGVQTAASVYFGKQVKDLTLAESALLAGLPQKPSSYAPYEDLEAAVRRRNIVLDTMADLDYITPEQRDKAKAEKVKLIGKKPSGINRYKAPWFVTYVIKELQGRYGEDMIYRGGLQVHTTLNYEMQQAAEKAFRDGINAARSRRVSQGALICIDPATGHIKAMVGSSNPDFGKDQFNRAVQAKRQPGSAFKAFVYTAAIDNGYDPNYRISNERKTWTFGDQSWTPRNYDGRYGGKLTIKQAVARSVNICAIRMAEQVGIDQVIRYAQMMGITSPLGRNLSLALGSSEVTPLEICSAYGVFAAKGMRAEPMAIVKITNVESRGQEAVIEDNHPVIHQVLSEQTAETMNEILRGVVVSRGGTGYAAAKVPDAHGKTGTTQQDRTAWFIGYTPQLATAVWVGNDDNSPMRNVWGGNVCAPIWSQFMLKALPVHEKEKLAAKAREKGENIEGDTSASFDSEAEKRAAERRAQRERERRTREELGEQAELQQDQPAQGTPDEGTPEPEPVTEPRPAETPAPERPAQAPALPPAPALSRYVTVTLCRDTGLLATRHCPSTYKVKMERGTEPTAHCTVHSGSRNKPAGPGRPGTANRGAEAYVTVTICVESGQLATMYCPQTISRQYPDGEAPTRYCRVHRPR